MSESKNFSDRFISAVADNNYRMYCEPTNKRAGYKLCQHVIAAYKEGKIKNNTYDKCIKAMKKNLCPALKMVLEEKRAGKILYYEKLDIKNIPEKPMAQSKPAKSVFGFVKRQVKNIISTTDSKEEVKSGIQGTSEILQSLIKEEMSKHEES